MKTKLRLKIIWESTITRVILVILIITSLLLAIILPSVLTSRPKDSVLAFNRDATSGTREAFVEKVLMPEEHGTEYTKDNWSPGSNVREVRNNDAMITFVKRQTNSIGYVSFGTVAEFDEDGNPVMKEGTDDRVSFATFDNIMPTEDNVKNGDYEASRNFNMFFRANKDSNEYEITKYDFLTSTFAGDISKVNSANRADDMKVAYLFYNWILYSEEALEAIETGYDTSGPTGEIPAENTRVDFSGSVTQDYISTIQLNKNNEQYLVEIVGSTSATALMTELTKVFDEEMSEIFNLTEDQLKFTLVTNGSGDAFKQNVPGADHPFIGIQSREAKEEELVNWGYDAVDENVYNPFAIDAILMIYNNQGVTLNEGEYLNISSEKVFDLYTYDNYLHYLKYNEEDEQYLFDIYTPTTLMGGDVNA